MPNMTWRCNERSTSAPGCATRVIPIQRTPIPVTVATFSIVLTCRWEKARLLKAH